MVMAELYNPAGECWRDFAASMRRLAEHEANSEARLLMLNLAQGYERLAALATVGQGATLKMR